MNQKFKVKIPTGYIVAVEEGEEDSYPGVLIYYSFDGEHFSPDNLISAVEYETADEEIRIESYCKDYDDPVAIFSFENGHDLLN